MLEKLHVAWCEELKHIITNEAEDDDDVHLNCASIFPKLQSLTVRRCNKLEFIFPSTLSRGLQKLKYIDILRAHKLKYVFGKYDEEECLSNEHENNEPHIHLPALESLELSRVPNMISIGIKKHQPECPSLQIVEAPKEIKKHIEDVRSEGAKESEIQEIVNIERPLLTPSVGFQHKPITVVSTTCKLTTLDVRHSNIEEVLNLEGVEIEGPFMTLSIATMRLENLSELRHTFRGPKYILSLPNLQELNITACKKLTAIFCVSVVKNLPQLSYLSIKECDELVDIIGESDGDHLHQLYFPVLKKIYIKCCDSLKFLFSISTCGMFPKLEALEIKEASELEQVFIYKQDDMRKMAKTEEVFPKLSSVTLEKLPRLISICEGIDFKDMRYCRVEDCPKYQETSQIQKEPQNGNSKNQATTRSVLPEFAKSSEEAMKRSVEEVGSSMMSSFDVIQISETREKVRGMASESSATTTSSSSSSKITEETLLKIQVKNPTLASVKQASGNLAAKSQLRGTSLQELEDEHRTSESTTQLQQEVLAQTKTTKASHKTYVPFDDNWVTSSIVSQGEGSQCSPSTLVASVKETHEQGSQEDDATEEAATAGQSADSDSRKKTQVSPITEQITESIKDTTQQGLEKNYVKDDAMTAVGSTNSDSRNRSTGPIDNLSGKDSALTVTKTGDRTSIQEESESEKPIKAIASRVITSLHLQSEIADDTGTSSHKLGVCEIFQLVELKDGEAALLAQALERYPQLLLPQEHRSQRMIAWSYRVLVDILVVLATKTPCSITSSEKTTLEASLCDATLLGFDKEWVDSVRSRVFGVDMSDVLAAEEEIKVKEAELETCDIALEQVRKQRVEARERLAVTRRQLEMAQTEFEATDSQLSSLLEGRKKLTTEITEFREIISAKHRPFGI
ncbi:uncharacterized protein LOC114742593 [Neltuma alba]|uniref:uncharacterized protein LOC114742593 n=1 Tax=Neltuma alba TaxID=207710 RepID=UPI0010A4722C|nr:uncharacterized protein LOC114742593 [Prosopis alba]